MEQKVIRLTKEEENDILISLSEEDYLGCGSSRAVFDYPANNKCVIKVAASEEGIYQNNTEISRYEKFGDKYLARIYAAGVYLLVAEKIDVLHDNNSDDEDYDEDNDDDCGEPNCQVFADDNFGYTSDNSQYGKREDGSIVLYDYGYTPDEPFDKQVGSMRSWVSYDGAKEVVSFVMESLGEDRVLNSHQVSRYFDGKADFARSSAYIPNNSVEDDAALTADRAEVMQDNDREGAWEDNQRGIEED